MRRRDALREAALNRFPFGGRDDPGEQIVRKDSLCALVAPINGERNALIEEGLVRLMFAALQLVPPQIQEQVVQRAILFSRMVYGAEHLVISAVQLIPVKGFGTAAIGCIRFCNHSDPADPRQHSSLADQSVIRNYDWRY